MKAVRKVSYLQNDDCEWPGSQINLLATFVPDLILNSSSSSSKQMNPFLGVLLCADIAGFTSLSESLAKSGDKGIYQLTSLLNSYLGNMVSEIYSNGGDVWKFSGDSFLAIWQVGIKDNYQAVVYRAVSCALEIQKKCAEYKSDFKINLRVKIGMSSGDLVWFLLGNSLSKRTILVGSPIGELIQAQSNCCSGDVVITSHLWSFLNPLYCVYEELDGFTKIIRNIGFMGLISKNKIAQLKSNLGWDLNKRSTSEVRRMPELKSDEPFNADLFLCIMSPVVQQIQAGLKFEYLTELRTLTIMFINIIPRKMYSTDLITLVNRAYIIIHELTSKAGGILNTVSLFDKDIMFLVIFGKTGSNHEFQTAASLFCGFDIRNACIALNGVNQMSVGIATGVCYCGVVGHPQRQEWTVIGMTVNKAARIMMAYSGQVSCDVATRDCSELPNFYFSDLPNRPLKGFTDDVICYKFNADKRTNLKNDAKNGLLPLLGRNAEMKLFHEKLRNLNVIPSSRTGILIIGKKMVGKTRLLNEMIFQAMSLEFETVVIGLRPDDSILAYATVIHILCDIFQVRKENAEIHLRQVLKSILSEYTSENDLTYIDHIFCSSLKHTLVSKPLKHLFLSGVKSSIIGIDDVHYCDASSRELLKELAKSEIKLLIFTQDDCVPSFIDHFNVIDLKEISNFWMPALVCQLLKVHAVDNEIIEFLDTRETCCIERLQIQLRALIKSNCIQVIDMNNIEKGNATLLLPDFAILEPIPINFKSLPNNKENVVEFTNDYENGWVDEEDFRYLECKKMQAILGGKAKEILSGDDIVLKLPLKNYKYYQNELRILTSENKSVNVGGQNVSKKAALKIPLADLNNCDIPEFPDNFITIFDSLQPIEQILLKCSSVIGNCFERSMLDFVLYSQNQLFVSRTIGHLFELNVLTCSLGGDSCICFSNCNMSTANRFCSHPCFRKSSLRDIIYDMITPNVKKIFHERVIEYLVSKPILCNFCRTETTSAISHDMKKCTCIFDESEKYRSILKHCEHVGWNENNFKHKIRYTHLQISLLLFDEAQKMIDDMKVDIMGLVLPRRDKKALLKELKLLEEKLPSKKKVKKEFKNGSMC